MDNLRKALLITFNAGVKCGNLHPDDNSYDTLHFHDALKRVNKFLPSPMLADSFSSTEMKNFAEWVRDATHNTDNINKLFELWKKNFR